MNLQALDNRELISETERIARTERACTIQLLHHLNEIARRKLHLDLGYQSLFDYCTKKLKYSSSAAGRRIAAARCIRRCPEVLALLEDGELSLCTAAMIEPILNEENAATILARVKGAPRREVERLLCEYRPPVALWDRIRPVRVAVNEPVEMDRLMLEREFARGTEWGWEDRRQIKDQLYVQFLADEELVAKFEQAKALLCGRHGDMSFADVLDVLVTEFLDRRSPTARKERREAKKKDREVHTPTGGSETVTKGGTEKKADSKVHTPTSGSRSRHIPAAVRDEVYTRDGGQCTFEGADGTRCEARKGLEIDHIRPIAAGGTNDPSNLRLLCPAHNLRAAEKALGEHIMAPFWQRE
ncbi:MAG TPA: HNH endonuclease signature motif containing protein [Candidatus Krumholzibacteria bacterium]